MARFLPLLLLLLLPLTAHAAECVVEAYGARGDGVTDCTAAVTAAITDCAAHGGAVLFGNGTYYFSTTVSVNSTVINGLTIAGVGWGSVLLWSADADLFTFRQADPVAHVIVRSLAVASINNTKSADSTAFRFSAGFVRGTFDSLLFAGQSAAVSTSLRIPYGATYQSLGSCIDMGAVSDTSSVVNTVMWFLIGTGVKIGAGSEIRILGGRIIGGCKYCNSIGVHVTGNNGGVHVASTDVIALNQGMLLDTSNGHGSNREIFITHATLDSNWRGLSISDESYVSVAGCWAASSDQDNIWISPQSANAILTVAGGTIFNAGSEGGDPSKQMCNGIVINAGRVSLNGVDIRNNKGIGVWVPGNVPNTVISGCQIFSNGQNLDLGGNSYIVTSNVCASGDRANSFGPEPNTAVIANNIGC